MKLIGKPVSSGINKGEILVLTRQSIHIPDTRAEDVEREIETLRGIITRTKNELRGLYSNAIEKLGEKEAEIFDAHITILQDEYSVQEPMEELIRTEQLNAVKAIDIQMQNLVEFFSGLDDKLLRERATDVVDLKGLLLRTALGTAGADVSHLDRDVILLAEELTPSDTVKMDTAHVVGLATTLGGGTSHTAIIARTLGIPAAFDIRGWDDSLNGRTAILDGDTGVLLVEPNEAELIVYQTKKRSAEEAAKKLESYRTRATITTDGVHIELCANIGSPEEAAYAVRSGAEGVGLFRSEFLFMNRNSLPTEEEQFAAYSKTLEAMGEKQVIVRTLDIGGDKKLPALGLPHEDNPFLGYRAIRLCLDREDIFRTQLRALLRASVFGRLGIMFPMISGIEELRQAKSILAEERTMLNDAGIPVGEIKVGMMIEIPSAALQASRLA